MQKGKKRPVRRRRATTAKVNINEFITALRENIDTKPKRGPTGPSLKTLRKLQQDRIESGNIEFFDLKEVYTVGMDLTTWFRGQMVCGKLQHMEMGQTFLGEPFWNIALQVLSMGSKGKVEFHTYSVKISPWKGTKTVDELPVHPISKFEKQELTSRGKIFREITSKISHMNYNSELMIPSWWDWTAMNGHGRVIIDGQGAAIMNPQVMDYAFNALRGADYYGRRDEAETTDNHVITDAELHYTWPVVVGFSFRQKRWGVINVNSISPIVFDKTVFDKLVLEPERKHIIKSLVEHSGEAFSDVIKGKSGGFVFLLHGSPGVGKTLTAEATAEVLGRPLYVVSVGELGTNPQALEEELSRILELADRWEAVLLLDESDIFLEQRTDHDLVRNAMVGIFLRQLEYFNGVMFLTTNRVKNFDKAFHSRISLAMSFPTINADVRRQIWVNLLEAAGIKGIDVSKLSDLELNGRQIKNCIRLAQTMSISNKTDVTTEMILKMTKFSEEFTTALQNGQNFA
jgi:hypothetical protein